MYTNSMTAGDTKVRGETVDTLDLEFVLGKMVVATKGKFIRRNTSTGINR